MSSSCDMLSRIHAERCVGKAMTRVICIEIACSQNTCGKCRFRSTQMVAYKDHPSIRREYHWHCNLFNKDIGTEKETPKRLPQCTSAEVEP